MCKAEMTLDYMVPCCQGILTSGSSFEEILYASSSNVVSVAFCNSTKNVNGTLVA